MRAVSIAAIATSLIATTSLSAAADQIITESFSVTIPDSVVPDNAQPIAEFSSTPFPLFDETNGALQSVNVSLSGAVTVVSLIAHPQIVVVLGFEDSPINADFIGSGTTNINLSGMDQPGFYIGIGNTVTFLAVSFAGNSAPNTALIASDGPLNGVVTYTYTPPTLTLSIPETPTWAAMLVGFASLAFAGRRARRKAAIRVSSLDRV